MESPAAPNLPPAPWTFADRMYGIAHCLVDRDGRVIGCNLPIANGPLLEQAREWLDSWGICWTACRRNYCERAPTIWDRRVTKGREDRLFL
jgi:hypothetical protein